MWLVMVVALGTLYLAYGVVAPTTILIYTYGWTRVWHDHLHILAMPKHQPWPVSNGDTITGASFPHFLIGLVSWWVLIIAAFSLFHLLRRIATTDNGR